MFSITECKEVNRSSAKSRRRYLNICRANSSSTFSIEMDIYQQEGVLLIKKAFIKQFYGIYEMIFGKLWHDVDYMERYCAVTNRTTP